MLDIDIRLASESDLPYILSIENTCFSSPWKKEDLYRELTENQFACFMLISIDNQIVGFCDYWQTFDSGTICQIAIDRHFRNMGFASRLLNEVLDDCFAKKITSITLEVRASNFPAIKLYEKFNFKTVCVKPHYYDDGEDALYMVRKVEI